MSKIIKIIIFLAIASALAMFVYLATQPKPIEQKNQSAVNFDLGLLEKNYKIQVKLILDNYLRLMAQDEESELGQISQAKEQLLSLKVPAKFKDLHLNLVLAMTQMEEYARDKNGNTKEQSGRIISAAKNQYEWLK